MTSSTDDRRAPSSAGGGTSKGTRASRSVGLGRTIRWAIVASGARKARAISSVVGPPSKRGSPGNDLGGFDAPNRLDRAVGVGRRHRLASFCATRALTSFRTNASERGLSTVNWIVPLDFL